MAACFSSSFRAENFPSLFSRNELKEKRDNFKSSTVSKCIYTVYCIQFSISCSPFKLQAETFVGGLTQALR